MQVRTALTRFTMHEAFPHSDGWGLACVDGALPDSLLQSEDKLQGTQQAQCDVDTNSCYTH